LERLDKRAGCTVEIHAVSQSRIESAKKRISHPLVLEPADLATLSLAQKISPDFVLTDDLTLRRVLDDQKQKPMGSAGLLLHAYKAGLLNRETLDQSIDRLFMHSTLYLSPQFKSYVRKLISDNI
jgi:predicted nucleic acid-binding protein